MSVVVCIDIGSVNVAVKFKWGEEEESLDFINGETLLPSVVNVGNGMKFGKAAVLSVSSGSVLTNLKLLIGKSFEDVVTRYRRLYLRKFNVPLENHDGVLSIPVTEEGETKYYKPSDVLRAMFSYIFNSLTERYGMDIAKTIVTVPERFSDIQREEYVAAAEGAGFQGVSLLDESVAATLAFMKTKIIFSMRKVLVFNFGGGSISISILQVDPRTKSNADGSITVEKYFISTLATSKIPKGGDDVDRELMEHLMTTFQNEHPIVQYISRENNKQDYYNLLYSVSQIKERGGGDVSLDGVIDNIESMDVLSIELKRDMINSVVMEYMEESITLLQNTIARAFPLIPEKSRISQIDMVLPVGGMCNIPCVTESLEKKFGKTVVCPPQLSSVLVDGGLVYASDQRYILENYEPITRNECYFKGSKDALYKDVIIPKGTRLPYVKRKFFKSKQVNQEWVETKFYVEKENKETKEIPVRFRNRKESPFMITAEVNTSFDVMIYVSFLSTKGKEYIQMFNLN